MKKIFQIVLVYALGLVCVFALAWRVQNININDNSLASNYNIVNETYNN